MSWEFERVAGPFGFTEGPVWDGETILFSDMPSATIRRYDHESGDCGVFADETGAANGLKFDDAGRLYACEMVGRRVVRYAGGRREPVAHGVGGTGSTARTTWRSEAGRSGSPTRTTRPTGNRRTSRSTSTTDRSTTSISRTGTASRE